MRITKEMKNHVRNVIREKADCLISSLQSQIDEARKIERKKIDNAIREFKKFSNGYERKIREIFKRNGLTMTGELKTEVDPDIFKEFRSYRKIAEEKNRRIYEINKRFEPECSRVCLMLQVCKSMEEVDNVLSSVNFD